MMPGVRLLDYVPSLNYSDEWINAVIDITGFNEELLNNV